MPITIKPKPAGSVAPAPAPGGYAKYLDPKQPVEALKFKQPQGSTTIVKSVGKQVVQEGTVSENVGGTVLETPLMCNVGVSGGKTIGLPGYSNVKIQVSLFMPCEKHDIEATYEFCTDWVSKKIKEATSALGGG